MNNAKPKKDSETKNNNQDNVDFLYQEARQATEIQKQAFEYVDKKAYWFLGLNLVVFSFMINNKFINEASEVCRLIWLISVGITLGFFIYTLWPKTYEEDPNLPMLVKKYGDKPEEEIKNQLIANLSRCYTNNDNVVKQKEEYFKRALTSMIVAGIISILLIAMNWSKAV